MGWLGDNAPAVSDAWEQISSWFAFNASGDGPPALPSQPTEADIAKREADKSNLRRQRAAALLAGGAKANILTSPLGMTGSSDVASAAPQGRKTLLGT